MPTTNIAYAHQGDGIRAYQISIQEQASKAQETFDSLRKAKNDMKKGFMDSASKAKTDKQRRANAALLGYGHRYKEAIKEGARKAEYGSHMLREDQGYDTGRELAPKVYRGRVKTWERRVGREEGGTYWNV